MASSMTGFGVGEFHQDGYTVNVELRSVNSRFLEVSCRLPPSFIHYERKIKEIIKKKIQRGKLYLAVSIQGENEGVLDIRVDQRIARAVRSLLDEICRTTGIQEELRLDHILKFSEIFEPMKEPAGAEKTWEGVKTALIKALDDLKRMRDREGESLARDIVKRVKYLERHLSAIERIAKKNIQNAYQRMVERVRILQQNQEVSEERLHAEIVLLADKLDVTEECVRFRGHNALFHKIMEESPVVGKKLNFLLQEMNREANTISAKANNMAISHHVVEIKEEVEKLREQVQNLE
ncbi:YicC family protein [bacterium]|nr:YicC family protein [bacterium]